MSRLGGDACAADDLAELALGTLAGEERSGVLAHVARCRTCAAELAGLAAVADDLLLLAPVAEAPLGFELRTVERLRAAEHESSSTDVGTAGLGTAAAGTAAVSRPARHRWRRAFSALAAAVLLVLAGLGIGILATSPSRSTRPAAREVVVLASLSSRGRTVGHVRVEEGKATWLEVTVGQGLRPGIVSCVVRLRDGRVVPTGWFQIGAQGSHWRARLDVGVSELASAQLLGPAGAVLASAPI